MFLGSETIVPTSASNILKTKGRVPRIRRVSFSMTLLATTCFPASQQPAASTSLAEWIRCFQHQDGTLRSPSGQ
jgi:hypothetical protein